VQLAEGLAQIELSKVEMDVWGVEFSLWDGQLFLGCSF
jgi:hypothetical protein